MDKRIVLAVFCLFLFSIQINALYAQQNLTIDLAEDHVDITTGFNGANLILFGTKEGAGDIAVVVKGPKKTMTVRKKNQIAGVWINSEWMNFKEIPGFYAYALSKPKEDLAKPKVLKEAEVGLESIVLNPESEVDDTKKLEEFQKALLRNKIAQNLYTDAPREIEFLNDDFFRTTLYIPANVPVGTYEIYTILFQKGKLKASDYTELRIAQVGMSARILEFAQEKSLSYGILCVLIAALMGWGITVIRNKG